MGADLVVKASLADTVDDEVAALRLARRLPVPRVARRRRFPWVTSRDGRARGATPTSLPSAPTLVFIRGLRGGAERDRTNDGAAPSVGRAHAGPAPRIGRTGDLILEVFDEGGSPLRRFVQTDACTRNHVVDAVKRTSQLLEAKRTERR